jgi:hypothetical protein
MKGARASHYRQWVAWLAPILACRNKGGEGRYRVHVEREVSTYAAIVMKSDGFEFNTQCTESAVRESIV